MYTTDGLCGATNDITIYAKWTPKKYYITFSGYGCDDLESKEVTYDSIIGELPSITKTGYTFYGWKNQNGEQVSADMIWKKTNNQILSPVLYIRYGAKGAGKDTWVTDQICMDIMYTVTTNSDEDVEKFSWDYLAKIKDEDCIPLENVSKSYREQKNG